MDRERNLSQKNILSGLKLADSNKHDKIDEIRDFGIEQFIKISEDTGKVISNIECDIFLLESQTHETKSSRKFKSPTRRSKLLSKAIQQNNKIKNEITKDENAKRAFLNSLIGQCQIADAVEALTDLSNEYTAEYKSIIDKISIYENEIRDTNTEILETDKLNERPKVISLRKTAVNAAHKIPELKEEYNRIFSKALLLNSIKNQLELLVK